MLRGALEKKLVKSRSSGCLNWDASIPLSILLLVAVVADGVDNAPMPFGRSKSSEIMIALFIFCVVTIGLITSLRSYIQVAEEKS